MRVLARALSLYLCAVNYSDLDQPVTAGVITREQGQGNPETKEAEAAEGAASKDGEPSGTGTSPASEGAASTEKKEPAAATTAGKAARTEKAAAVEPAKAKTKITPLRRQFSWKQFLARFPLKAMLMAFFPIFLVSVSPTLSPP